MPAMEWISRCVKLICQKEFENHQINLENGDKVFFFSDGLPDQVGGNSGKKYQASRIRELIVNNPDLKMNECERFFFTDFEKWRGDFKQIDDVLLIGIEF